MPYATVEQVASRCRGLPLGPGGSFNSTTFVTADAVAAWLDEAEREVNQTVQSIGGSPPYTDPDAQSLLGQITATYAEARVYQVHEKANGEYGVGSAGYQTMVEYGKKLDSICDYPGKWLDKLNEGRPGTFRGHVAHGTKGQSVDDGDFDTRFPSRIIDTGF